MSQILCPFVQIIVDLQLYSQIFFLFRHENAISLNRICEFVLAKQFPWILETFPAFEFRTERKKR